MKVICFFLTGPNELVIDELPTVIRIDPQKRKGKPCSNLPGFKDPVSHFVFDRLSFQSSRSRHRSHQIPTGVSAIVGNQIDFTESWSFLIPIGKGTNWNPVFQESPGFGVGPEDWDELSFFLLEKPIHGGWRYGQKLPSHLLGENQFLMLFQLFDHPRE